MGIDARIKMNPALQALRKRDRNYAIANERNWRRRGDWGAWEVITFDRPVDLGAVGIFAVAHRNKVFAVLDRQDFSGARHLAVASLTGDRPTWHEMQRIKDDLAGPEATAIEVYPPRSEVIDGADMFHIWVLPGRLPFSLARRAG